MSRYEHSPFRFALHQTLPRGISESPAHLASVQQKPRERAARALAFDPYKLIPVAVLFGWCVLDAALRLPS